MIDRLRGTVRLEDVLLVVWLVLVEPLLFPIDESTALTPNPVEGLFGLVGLVGLAVCVGARSQPGVETGLSAQAVPFFVGPLLGALAFVVADTTNDLGILGAGPVLVIGLIVVGIAGRVALPALGAVQRRALVTPFILGSGAAFGTFLSGFGDLFDLGAVARDLQAGGLDIAFAVFLLALVLLGVLVFYVMLVFAPRQVAEREGTPGGWTIRFALFVISLVVGSTLSGIVRG